MISYFNENLLYLNKITCVDAIKMNIFMHSSSCDAEESKRGYAFACLQFFFSEFLWHGYIFSYRAFIFNSARRPLHFLSTCNPPKI